MAQHDRSNLVHRDADLATVITISEAIAGHPVGTDLETILRQAYSILNWLEQGGSPSISADAIVRRVVSAQFTARATQLRTASFSRPADAYLIITISGSIQSAAVFLATRAGSISADADIVTSATTVPGSFDGSALILATMAGSFSGSAIVLRSQSGSFTADSSISTGVSSSFDGSAVILRTISGSFTADASLVIRSFTADAYIAGGEAPVPMKLLGYELATEPVGGIDIDERWDSTAEAKVNMYDKLR